MHYTLYSAYILQPIRYIHCTIYHVQLLYIVETVITVYSRLLHVSLLTLIDHVIVKYNALILQQIIYIFIVKRSILIVISLIN